MSSSTSTHDPRLLAEYLASEGVDWERVLNARPKLYLDVDTARTRFLHLESLGIDPASAVNAWPGLLGRSVERIDASFQNLVAQGLDASQIAADFPNVLAYATANINGTIKVFRDNGVDPEVIALRTPRAFSYSSTRILLIMCVLKQAGIWERTRDNWNHGRDHTLFTIPVESLLLQLSTDPDAFRARPGGSRHAVRYKGLKTTAQRVQALASHLGLDGSAPDPEFMDTLGLVGPLYGSHIRGSGVLSL